MTKERFIELLRDAVANFTPAISCENGDWAVKGFIDIYKTIYTISTDTKIVSKILELYIFPKIIDFATKNKLEIELTQEQNFYPDITFKDKEGNLFCCRFEKQLPEDGNTHQWHDIRSIHWIFPGQEKQKNITHPYEEYKAHIVLGIIYTPAENVDERKVYTLEQLEEIISVVKDFDFFVQEKWKIATDHPGSGNTKNIGSISNIRDLKNGNGPFASLGEKFFDDYWSHYLTKDMAKAAELTEPYYSNLAEYKRFKNLP